MSHLAPRAEGPTYAHRFLDAVRRFGPRPALRAKSGGVWTDTTYAALGERVLDCAAGLRRCGIEPGDRVAIWLETSPAWVLADLATQAVGAVTATVYHTLPAVQAAAILRDCGAKALVTTAGRLAGLAGERVLGSLVALAVTVDAPREGAVPFETLIAQGRAAREADPAIARALVEPAVRPEDLSAIIYTSGTTGEPKGAMLTHRNVVGYVDCAIGCFMPRGGHVSLLHLPLAHVMARNTAEAATLLTGSVLAIAEPEREKLPANLVEVAPTAFITVPYLLEKFMARVRESVAQKGGLGRALAERALALGRARRLAALGEAGGPPRRQRLGLRLALLDRLVLRKVRARLGGRLEFIVIGGSNSNRESVEFFWGLGIPVYEGYGATEVTTSVSFTWPGDVKLGTVGRPPAGMEVRLGPDGEVLARGPFVMKGYWGRPDATREAIDEDGWYHTGDVGVLDEGGYLRIVDRKKEIFALSTGKKVAPQAVENALKTSACVAGACAIGDQRRYMTALIVPDLAAIGARLGLAAPPAAGDPRVREVLEAEVRAAAAAAGLADFERPKRFAVIGEPFTPENGLLTPTLKLRRKPIAERYAAEIERLYGDAATPAGAAPDPAPPA